MTTEILRNMLYRVGDDGATADERLKVSVCAAAATRSFARLLLVGRHSCCLPAWAMCARHPLASSNRTMPGVGLVAPGDLVRYIGRC